MEHDKRMYNRVRTLPTKVENAYRRVRELEEEARAIGARDIVRELSVVNRAWDREIQAAQLKAGAIGGVNSVGVDDL